MSTSSEKISVSIGKRELRWARERAQRAHVSLSAVFTEAVRLARQHEARLALLQWLGPKAQPTRDEEAAIRKEWGERPAPKRSKR